MKEMKGTGIVKENSDDWCPFYVYEKEVLIW